MPTAALGSESRRRADGTAVERGVATWAWERGYNRRHTLPFAFTPPILFPPHVLQPVPPISKPYTPSHRYRDRTPEEPKALTSRPGHTQAQASNGSQPSTRRPPSRTRRPDAPEPTDRCPLRRARRRGRPHRPARPSIHNRLRRSRELFPSSSRQPSTEHEVQLVLGAIGLALD